MCPDSDGRDSGALCWGCLAQGEIRNDHFTMKWNRVAGWGRLHLVPQCPVSWATRCSKCSTTWVALCPHGVQGLGLPAPTKYPEPLWVQGTGQVSKKCPLGCHDPGRVTWVWLPHINSSDHRAPRVSLPKKAVGTDWKGQRSSTGTWRDTTPSKVGKQTAHLT
jgi:hypothetical protein